MCDGPGTGAHGLDPAAGHGAAFYVVAVYNGLVTAPNAFRSAFARALGGVRVGRDTTDLRLRRLLNVVEEMAIAPGVPVPDVYVLEHEAGINAFAAGRTPANAAVAVTRGALERLDREQLQGVIAHEFSHILTATCVSTCGSSAGCSACSC